MAANVQNYTNSEGVWQISLNFHLQKHQQSSQQQNSFSIKSHENVCKISFIALTIYIEHMLSFSPSDTVRDHALVGPTVTQVNGPLKEELPSNHRHPVRQSSPFPASNQKKNVTINLQMSQRGELRRIL